MNIRTQTTKIFFLILSVFILGCIFVSPPKTAEPATAEAGTPLPSLSELATATLLPPTAVPTATVYPPVFDPDTLGDIRELASFIMNVTIKNTEDGKVIHDIRYTFEYIKQPFSMHSELGNMYVIGDALYERINAGMGWSYQAGISQADVQDDLDWQVDAEALDSHLQSAQFLDQEDFNGIPANHFTLDKSNFRVFDPPAPGEHGSILEEAQGDIYLAQDGNYLLYSHVVKSGTTYEPNGTQYPYVQEKAHELSMINQLTEIAVPADFLALNLNCGGLPLPAGTMLTAITFYNDILGIESYFYTTSVSYDEFLEFYKNLVPTDGWAFSHIGQVANHVNCGDRDCVILKKGNGQAFLLYGEGSFFVDYDKQHEYDPK